MVSFRSFGTDSTFSYEISKNSEESDGFSLDGLDHCL